eukprot:5512666-Prymnesium_polylepis.1
MGFAAPVEYEVLDSRCLPIVIADGAASPVAPPRSTIMHEMLSFELVSTARKHTASAAFAASPP